jgi:hypothetical protein
MLVGLLPVAGLHYGTGRAKENNTLTAMRLKARKCGGINFQELTGGAQ